MKITKYTKSHFVLFLLFLFSLIVINNKESSDKQQIPPAHIKCAMRIENAEAFKQ